MVVGIFDEIFSQKGNESESNEFCNSANNLKRRTTYIFFKLQSLNN